MGNVDELRYSINEIFKAPQGEGHHLGTYCNFVRFSGCNLKCAWCDTKHESGQMMALADIEASLYARRPIVVTGGEPMLMPNIEEFAEYFYKRWDRLHLETNGSLPLVAADAWYWIAVSPKPQREWSIHESFAGYVNEIKVVIDDAVEVKHIEALEKAHPKALIWLQPCSGEPWSMRTALAWQKLHPTWLMGIQAHRYWECK